MIATCFGDRPFTYLDKKNFFSSLSSTILRQVLDNICEAPIYCSLFFFFRAQTNEDASYSFLAAVSSVS